jgi:hypothetical protein
VPFNVSVSAREPESVHTPTVAFCTWGCDSVVTVRLFERVVTSVKGFDDTAVVSDHESICHDHQGRNSLTNPPPPAARWRRGMGMSRTF